jgi:hypothetical protein
VVEYLVVQDYGIRTYCIIIYYNISFEGQAIAKTEGTT